MSSWVETSVADFSRLPYRLSALRTCCPVEVQWQNLAPMEIFLAFPRKKAVYSLPVLNALVPIIGNG
jgi:hypothetical protein